MAEYEAAVALLMLSSGFQQTAQQIESSNNDSPALSEKPEQQPCDLRNEPSPPVAVAPMPSDTAPVPKSKVEAPTSEAALSSEDLIHKQMWQNTLRAASNGTEMSQNGPVQKSADQACSSNSEGSSTTENGAAAVKVERPSIIYSVGRFGSSSPDLQQWESGRTSSPIVQSSNGLPSPHSVHEGYDSPGMNGFAMRLNRAVDHNNYVSSPEPLPMPAPAVSEGERKRRKLYDGPKSSTCTTDRRSSSNPEEKSLNSPTDSGVSSIHDEILQSTLTLQMWSKGTNAGEGLPPCVRIELNKIIDISTHNKKLFSDAKMTNYPLEMGFNPNKSRLRKECSNEIDKQDREKNNEASRRSRHKKKLMTQMMNISLEFDRNENSQLHMQERWLTNMIFELEEKLLNQGTEPQMLRKLRSDIGFQ